MSTSINPVIYRNIREFLKYRGTTHGLKELTDKEVHDLFLGDGPQQFVGERANGSKVIVAVFMSTSKHLKGSKEFLAAITALNATNTREVLVVLGEGMPDRMFSKYTVIGNNKFGNTGRVVGHKIFLTNLPTITLVPKHRVLSAEETVALEYHYYMGRENITSYILWQKDPACIWCGAMRGDVVEIRRQNDVSGECTDYRLCV